MQIKREDNPFEEELIAHEWIRSVEGEKGMIRDNEIYPMLEKWCSTVTGQIVDVGSGQGIERYPFLKTTFLRYYHLENNYGKTRV